MRVKFCGITNLDDAAEGVRLGAWAIGLIHYEKSPRFCEPAEAVAIAAAFRRKCEVVGVFVNPELDEVAGAVEDEGLTMVQLNGEEGPSFCAEIARRTGVKVIKAIHVASAADIHAAEAHQDRLPPLRPPRQGPLGRQWRELRLGPAVRASL